MSVELLKDIGATSAMVLCFFVIFAGILRDTNTPFLLKAIVSLGSIISLFVAVIALITVVWAD